MIKSLYTFFAAVALSGVIVAQSNQKAEIYNPAEKSQIDISRTVVIPAASLKEKAAILFDNGSAVSLPGGGPSGSDGSVLDAASTGLTSYGININRAIGFAVADDFTVPAGVSWKIDSVKIYSYQTGSALTSTYTGGFYQIWDGFPKAAGSKVVFGDTTNRMVASRWSGAYRYSSSSVGTTRPIMEIVLSGNVTLQPGKYYLEFSATGSLSSGPWTPPITITGQSYTGNGLSMIEQWGGFQTYIGDTTKPQTSTQGWPFKLYGTSGTVPVELASFTSSVKDGIVTLSWATATETNNLGFQVERKSSKDNVWAVAGFVKGNSTTSEISRYSYTDNLASLGAAVYNYRLKQVDFDGTAKYYDLSQAVEVSAPKSFSLNQNYPNPFNPSTSITFSVPVDSKVKLDVYDVLGKVVKTLVNEQKAAGSYTVTMDASALSSGVYFYRLSADGNTLIKKMNLMK